MGIRRRLAPSAFDRTTDERLPLAVYRMPADIVADVGDLQIRSSIRSGTYPSSMSSANRLKRLRTARLNAASYTRASSSSSDDA